MPYFKSFDLLYIHIPKTGGMSIEEYFYNKCNIVRGPENISGWNLSNTPKIRFPNNRSLQHLTYQEICQYEEFFDFKHVNINNTTILVSVRNPYERVLSDLSWNNKIQNIDNLDETTLYNIIYNYL